MKNKIGWCNTTWNPCWGCLNHHCEYCYARTFAKRFYKDIAYINTKTREEYQIICNKLALFEPVWLKNNFAKKFPQKTQKIFVGSMSEIYYWDEVWIQKVIDKVKLYPQHIFQFLTRYPEVYSKYDFPKNCWLGVTITHIPKYKDDNRWDFNSFIRNEKINNLKFVSFEPLLGDIHPYTYLNFDKEINWVIFGAETGNRKNKIIPKREWMEDIINHCKYRNIPVYLKDSLKEIYPIEIKEFPKMELIDARSK